MAADLVGGLWICFRAQRAYLPSAGFAHLALTRFELELLAGLAWNREQLVTEFAAEEGLLNRHAINAGIPNFAGRLRRRWLAGYIHTARDVIDCASRRGLSRRCLKPVAGYLCHVCYSPAAFRYSLRSPARSLR